MDLAQTVKMRAPRVEEVTLDLTMVEEAPAAGDPGAAAGDGTAPQEHWAAIWKLADLEVPADCASDPSAESDALAAAAPQAFAGVIHRLPLMDLLQLLHLSQASAVVEFLPARDAIYFCQGQIVHAVAGALSGRAALTVLLGEQGGQFATRDLPETYPTTLGTPFEGLLLGILCEADEAAAQADASWPPERAAHLESAAGGRPAGQRVAARRKTARREAPAAGAGREPWPVDAAVPADASAPAAAAASADAAVPVGAALSVGAVAGAAAAEPQRPDWRPARLVWVGVLTALVTGSAATAWQVCGADAGAHRPVGRSLAVVSSSPLALVMSSRSEQPGAGTDGGGGRRSSVSSATSAVPAGSSSDDAPTPDAHPAPPAPISAPALQPERRPALARPAVARRPPVRVDAAGQSPARVVVARPSPVRVNVARRSQRTATSSAPETASGEGRSAAGLLLAHAGGEGEGARPRTDLMDPWSP